MGHEPFFTTYVKKGGTRNGTQKPWFETSFAGTIDYIFFKGDVKLDTTSNGLVEQAPGAESIFTTTRFDGELPITGSTNSRVALAEQYFLPLGLPNWKQPSD